MHSNIKHTHSNHWLMVCVHYGFFFIFIEKKVQKECSTVQDKRTGEKFDP